jgi:prepilin-type N-terminal cleavage/methylation domain-containing protein
MKKHQKNLGFTLIELIVALGVFSVVVTTAVGSVLSLINNNQKLQAEQNIMSQLSFALDTMAREMRSGYNYYCTQDNSGSEQGSGSVLKDGTSNNPDYILRDNPPSDCRDGNDGNATHLKQGVSFSEGGDSLTGSGDRITYFYDKDEGKIMRKLGGENAQSILPSNIYVRRAEFYVSGSEDLTFGGTNVEQPTITIYIEASATTTATDKVYRLQTTLTQRILDL